MFKRFSHPACLATVVACLYLMSSGCEKSEPAGDTTKPSTDAASVVEIEAKLATADAVDGKVDKIVSKCAACALSMDGSEEHILEVHGYTMHFCTAACRDHYAADPDKAIMSMKVPAK